MQKVVGSNPPAALNHTHVDSRRRHEARYWATVAQENVELIRPLYDLFVERDIDTAFRDYLRPDFAIRIPEGYPEGGQVFRGRKGVLDWLAMIDDVWADWHYENHRYIDAGEEVVAILRVVAEGTSSGLRFDREVGHVWRISEGRAAGVTVYLDVDEALRAARVRA
jgi:ketosteroid isomerase-like protein